MIVEISRAMEQEKQQTPKVVAEIKETIQAILDDLDKAEEERDLAIIKAFKERYGELDKRLMKVETAVSDTSDYADSINIDCSDLNDRLTETESNIETMYQSLVVLADTLDCFKDYIHYDPEVHYCDELNEQRRKKEQEQILAEKESDALDTKWYDLEHLSPDFLREHSCDDCILYITYDTTENPNLEMCSNFSHEKFYLGWIPFSADLDFKWTIEVESGGSNYKELTAYIDTLFTSETLPNDKRELAPFKVWIKCFDNPPYKDE